MTMMDFIVLGDVFRVASRTSILGWSEEVVVLSELESNYSYAT